jgi:DNA-binding GntR family transcriptional regulator
VVAVDRGKDRPVTEAVPTNDGAATSRAVDHLRAAILRGDLRPGDRIRQEEFAAQLGGSRVPVREALRVLEAEGLTEHVPHKGSRVIQLSTHEVDVVYQMRERLEPLALAESLLHLDSATLSELHEIQDAIEANDDLERFLELDRALHLTSYSGCAEALLSTMVTRLWNTTQHYRREFVRLGGPSRMWVVNAEHRLILDALERRDPVDAERNLSGHIRRTRIELAQHPELFERSVP